MIAVLEAVRSVARDEASAVERLHAAGEALVTAGVAGGGCRKPIEARVGGLGEAIAERSSWTGADLADHEAEEIAALRAAIASWADPALIAAYERTVTLEQEAVEAFNAALRALARASARAALLGAVDEAHRALVAGWLDHAHPDLTGVRVSGARINKAYSAAEARGQCYAGSPDEIACSADLQRALTAITATHAALIALLTALGVDAAEADGLVHRYEVAVGDDCWLGD